MSFDTSEVIEQRLESNQYFELLGHNGDAVFMRHARSGSVVKLRGKLTPFMLAQVAPMTWWERNFPKRPGWHDKLTAAKSFVIHAAYRMGLYDEEGIARRRIADEKLAAQPAPVITGNGLPAALVVKETKTHFHVRCPFCGDEHQHGAPLLGARVPHCSMNYPGGLPDYELVRDSVARAK
ncbi:hypothetical protein [Paraburkholderia sp. GAS42]|uniref:hypothetical protein n=1 Tax=Paraburkholderia sp. GAS42 TaxID=3035135 RepID=UPI003D1C0DA0